MIVDFSTVISVHFQSLDALSCVLIFLNSSDVSSSAFLFLLFYRCNDRATVNARMSLVYLAHKLYHCSHVSPVYLY